MKSFIRNFIVLIVLMILGAAVFVGSGFYNFAANVPHWKWTFWIIETARERSVSFHSSGIELPPLKGQKLVDMGFPHFHEMCRLCHGAPGYNRDEFADGLYPNPPVLNSEEVQQELDDADLFWVVKNGIKMTGMPSFGSTHSEEAIQTIVAFLRRMPDLTAEGYAAMVKAGPSHEKGGNHHTEEDMHHHSGEEKAKD